VGQFVLHNAYEKFLPDVIYNSTRDSYLCHQESNSGALDKSLVHLPLSHGWPLE